MKFRFYYFLVLAVLIIFSACKKEPGPGGQASVQGKLLVKSYNSNCSNTPEIYYGIDEDVFIIYGDEQVAGERVRTGPDGTFRFDYLQKGDYTVYALSEDCAAPGDLTTVKQQVTITDRKQQLVLPDIEVIR
jgi:hypothetical protein